MWNVHHTLIICILVSHLVVTWERHEEIVWNVHHTLAQFTIALHLEIYWSGMTKKVWNVHHSLIWLITVSQLASLQERHDRYGMECPSCHGIVHNSITPWRYVIPCRWRFHILFKSISYPVGIQERYRNYGMECPSQHGMIYTGCIWLYTVI